MCPSSALNGVAADGILTDGKSGDWPPDLEGQGTVDGLRRLGLTECGKAGVEGPQDVGVSLIEIEVYRKHVPRGNGLSMRDTTCNIAIDMAKGEKDTISNSENDDTYRVAMTGEARVSFRDMVLEKIRLLIWNRRRSRLSKEVIQYDNSFEQTGDGHKENKETVSSDTVITMPVTLDQTNNTAVRIVNKTDMEENRSSLGKQRSNTGDGTTKPTIWATELARSLSKGNTSSSRCLDEPISEEGLREDGIQWHSNSTFSEEVSHQ
ncbi:hypothetical protein V6N13_048945 [Hibiscus sabdariffa]